MSAKLACLDLTKRYGGLVALDHIDLELAYGRIVGLLGPNGSGKTTLLKLANGLLVPNGGEILIDGLKPGIETKKFVSYLPDAHYLPNWMDVKTLLAFFADFYEDFDMARAKDMLDRLAISEKATLKTLSRGTKEKVQLILAMSRRASVYLLDEPIGGVDPASRDYILETILRNYSEDALVVISTHLIADVERMLDEAVIINNGKLIAHRTVDDIRMKEGKSVDEYFREVFRCWAN